MGSTLPIALTVDDAPSVAGDGARFDPARMDAVRATLRASGVTHCVAFVIGDLARGHEQALTRWLADGFELGNHGQHHRRASGLEVSEFAAELRACDALLREVGAFAQGGARYFRLPFGDRGRDAEQRRALREVVLDLGYATADVSVNLYDWCYEPPITRAVATGDEAATARILARFHRAAHHALRHARDHRPANDWVDVAALHFGEVTTRGLDALLRPPAPSLEWRALSQAVAHPRYAEMLSDTRVNGILGDRIAAARGGVWRGPLRRAARALRRLDWLGEERLGPIAPRWSA